MPTPDEYLSYIESKAVQDALRYIIAVAEELDGYRLVYKGHGEVKRDVKFMRHDGRWAYSLTPAQASLRFYLRHPGKTNPDLTRNRLAQCFQNLREQRDGTLSFLITNVAEARLMLQLVFHVDDAAAQSASTNGQPPAAILNDGDADESEYEPHDDDMRPIVAQQIRARRGQAKFRDSLCKKYGSRCMVTGSEVLAILEAAHIRPYRGPQDSHLGNGLLLRADIHTLFDLNLLGIEPTRLRVELHPSVANDPELARLAGRQLLCGARKPSRSALQLRYRQFEQFRDAY